jgi:hypothetical protein
MNVVIIFLQLKLKVVEGTRAKESSVSSLGFTGPSRNAVRRKSGSREGDCFHRDGMESQWLSIRVIAAMATTCTWWCRCGWTSPESPRDGRDAWRSVAGAECGRPPAGEENREMGILHGTVQRHGSSLRADLGHVDWMWVEIATTAYRRIYSRIPILRFF